MRPYRGGPIETLSDAYRARRKLWLLCRQCGHATKVDPRHFIVLLGQATLRDVQRKLKCRRCRQHRAAIVVNDVEEPGRD